MSHNSALMLKSTTTVRRSQRQHVKGNKQYEKAIKEGVRVSQDYYGNPFVSELRVYAQEGKWKRTVQGILVRPGQLAAPHPVHRRDVAAAPGVGEPFGAHRVTTSLWDTIRSPWPACTATGVSRPPPVPNRGSVQQALRTWRKTPCRQPVAGAR